MDRRLLVLLAMLLLIAAGAACGAAGQNDTQSRQSNQVVPRQGLGAGGDIGATPHETIGGRGGSQYTPKGKQ